MALDATNVSYLLGLLGLGGVVFSIYNSFRNPQIRTDQITIKFQEDILALQKQMVELRETHIKTLENDVKLLTTAVNDLSKTVIKLSTIIDERIPKK